MDDESRWDYLIMNVYSKVGNEYSIGFQPCEGFVRRYQTSH